MKTDLGSRGGIASDLLGRGAGGSQGAVGRDMDAMSPTPLDQVIVPEVGMHLHLIDRWLDAGPLDQGLQLLDAKIADPNSLHQTLYVE